MADSKYTIIFHSVSRQLGRYFVNGDSRRGESRSLLKILTYCVADHQEELIVFSVWVLLLGRIHYN